MTDPFISAFAADLITRAAAKGQTVTTAESCTGGLIAAALTDVPGSSAVFTHGFVTYANEAKRDMIGVPQHLLDDHGAVSAQVAGAMAKGALTTAKADLALSVTGIAGPGGGSPEKPVGLVYMGIATANGVKVHRHQFTPAGRHFIRKLTVREALRHGVHAL